MASSIRAPKQWILTKTETITSFEAWRQNLTYSLSLDPLFAPFMLDNVSWLRKTNANPTRGLEDDAAPVPENKRLTAVQKVQHLELMLGQIANYAPILSRNTIIGNSTSLASVWQSIRQHFGFQKTGGHFLDLAQIRREPEERPEDLFQRITAFMDDNLLKKNEDIVHHGEKPDQNEEMSPSLENTITVIWLQLLHPGLPRLVQQRYGTELRKQTLASLKPEIALALDSLMDELRFSEDAKIMRSYAERAKPSSKFSDKRKICALCREARRPHNHFLSMCKFLPESDRKFMSRARFVMDCDDTSDQYDDEPTAEPPLPEPTAAPKTSKLMVGKISIRKSPEFHVFYGHHPLRLTIDSGAECNLISNHMARHLKLTVRPTIHTAVQADGHTPLPVLGETRIAVTRDEVEMYLDAVVVESLEVDFLAGMPFLEINDITLRPARHEITVQEKTFKYKPRSSDEKCSPIRRAHIELLRSPPSSSVILPGEHLKLSVPKDLSNCELVLEPRLDNKSTAKWIAPETIQAVGDKVRIYNGTEEPQRIIRNTHICQVTSLSERFPTERATESKDLQHNTNSTAHLIRLDPDQQLPAESRDVFKNIHDTV